jgi:MFS family permease
VFPFVGTALIALAGIPILYTFPRVDDLSPQTAEDASPLRIRQAIELLRGQLTHPDVRWFVVFAAVFYSLFVVTRIYEQPVLDTVGIPVAGLGVLYAGFKLVSAVIASTAGRVHDLFGTRGVMAGIAPVYAVTYASIAVAPFLIVVTLFLNRGLRTLTNPVINQYLNTHTDDMGRATVLSGASMVLALIGAAPESSPVVPLTCSVRSGFFPGLALDSRFWAGRYGFSRRRFELLLRTRQPTMPMAQPRTEWRKILEPLDVTQL